LNFTISHVDSSLIWNTGADSFSNGFARSNGNLGVGVTAVDPFGAGGKEDLLVGFNGAASVSGSSSRTAGSLRVGTDMASAFISGRNGNGSVTASGSMNLTLSSTTSSGDLTIGEGGYTGTVSWNSTGTFDVQGRFRVGQGGNGTFIQNGGIVVAGNTDGSLKFAGIGINAGSNGTYNINAGTFRPGGGIPGNQDRQVIVGDVGGTGNLNIGDGTGSAATAIVETDDDIILGRSGGVGTMAIKSDGKLTMSGNGAALTIGTGAAGVASVTQTGGQVMIDGELQIGASAGATGSYIISGGSLTSANDGASSLLIGRSGATGTLRVQGTANVVHKAEAFIGNLTNSGAIGRLEIAGSTSNISFGQLENSVGGAAGVRETIRWEADANGVTPLTITGIGPLATDRVQLQDPTEVATNTGANGSGNLLGDGTALELDLSAIATSMTLTLINNQSTDPITGFFENGTSLNLYEEGELVYGSGFNGAVRISYLGGTGNDVTLSLVALAGDYDRNGVVDTADYVIWRNTGINGEQGYLDWRANFGATVPTPPAGSGNGAAVPEPGHFASCMLLVLMHFARRWRRS
jgi:hypothetical protein